MSSTTAEFMALFRALETARAPSDRLFRDPFAACFLRPSLRLVARAARRPTVRRAILGTIDRLWPGARASGVARTRLIDDALLESLERGVAQVVVLGAGFDCRAHRLPLPPGTRVLEVDRPETQTGKRRGLERCAAAPLRPVTYAPCDFESFRLFDCLLGGGFDPDRPSFFLWEGVTNYLTDEAVDSVLESLSGCAPGSVLVFTYVDRLAIDEPRRFAGTRLLRWALARSREPWTFGLDPARTRGFLRDRGFDLVADIGSVDYRATCLGDSSRDLRGYEFYRVAVATVADGLKHTAARGGR